MLIPLRDWEKDLTWNHAKLRFQVGSLEPERWAAYQKLYLKIHGEEPSGLAGSVKTASNHRTYRTGGVTTYNEAGKRGSNHAAEKRQQPQGDL